MTLCNKTTVEAILLIESNHTLSFIITFLFKKQLSSFRILFCLAVHLTSN